MERILLFLITYPVILISLSFHEFSHALAADKLGDPTAKYLGRLTLNPIVHIDIMGTVILPIIMTFTGLPLFGWAKPVPVNPLNFRNTRRDLAIVSFAGPASNFILCIASIILIFIFSIFVKSTGGSPENGMVLIAMILFFFPIINIFLMIFNLIPVPPLDGAGILRHFLPFRVEEKYDRILSPFKRDVGWPISYTELDADQQKLVDVMYDFGVSVSNFDYKMYKILGNQKYTPTEYAVEGDWSGAAFPLVAAAINGR